MVNWFNNLKMQTRLLLVFSTIVLIAALAVGWFIYTIIQFDQEVERVVSEARELAEVEEVQVYLLEQQLAINDFHLTGSPEYLTAYERAKEEAGHYLRIALVDANTAEQRDTLGLITDELEAYNRTFDEIIDLFEAGEMDAAQELADEVSDLEEERVQAIHEQIERFVYKGDLQLQADTKEADTRSKQSIVFGVVILLLLSGLTVAASLATNQVAEPILHMTNAVVAFENDAFEPALLESYLKRREEMGQLARSFNNMVESIVTTSRSKDQLLSAASRFVPTNYLEFLEKANITEIKLGDHVSAEMAVMFSDIRSFTTISEGMTPQENFDFVNDYLKQVSPAIKEHNGFVVKFLGDGMMAIFPYDVEDALKAGINKMKVVHRLNASRASRSEPPIEVGIGIHTGHMMVGMIGEEGRMQGDAFSDNVNLTARIEGLNKFFGTSLIISAETLNRLEEPGRYQIRPLGQVIVKGRDNPIALFEVYDGDLDEIKEQKSAALDTFKEALEFYRYGALDKAQARFEQVLEVLPSDKSAAMYLEQIAYYQKYGKPELWDGVIVMTSK